jgi:allantoicase
MSHTADTGAALHLFDLSNEELGGAVLWANDEFFAEKENLIRASEPVWKEDVYTDRGKWMDGWESRRRRVPGHDSCIVRLGVPGTIEQIVVDTAFFRGNFPESCMIEGLDAAQDIRPEELLASDEWVEILAQSTLQGHHKNRFDVADRRRFTHLRLHIFPDGGVARLRVFGSPVPEPSRCHGTVDLVSALNGGATLAQSDMFFGLAQNLLKPERGRNMGDGWETRRRRGPGHDWVLLLLADEGIVQNVEVDTNHFKGNYPDRCSLELYSQEPRDPELENAPATVISEHKLQAHTRHDISLDGGEAATHAVLRIYPDGGVSRLRLWGQLTERGRAGVSLRYLNAMHERAAFEVFLACCGSKKWALAMVASLPFATTAALTARADELWIDVDDADRLEAFSAHPQIGEKSDSKWSRGEQQEARTHDAGKALELADLNSRYFDAHGFIFIICATGLSSETVLQRLRERVDNDTATEIATAAAEQAEITKLRLNKWLQGE